MWIWMLGWAWAGSQAVPLVVPAVPTVALEAPPPTAVGWSRRTVGPWQADTQIGVTVFPVFHPELGLDVACRCTHRDVQCARTEEGGLLVKGTPDMTSATSAALGACTLGAISFPLTADVPPLASPWADASGVWQVPVWTAEASASTVVWLPRRKGWTASEACVLEPDVKGPGGTLAWVAPAVSAQPVTCAHHPSQGAIQVTAVPFVAPWAKATPAAATEAHAP